MRSVTIGIVGAGGDGVVVLGGLLQRLAAAQGYFSQMSRHYGAQIRGGGSAVRIVLDAERSSMPQDDLDVLVCFSWEKYEEFRQELPLTDSTLVIYEEEPPSPGTLQRSSFQANLSQRSQEATGTPQNKNIVALGLLHGLLALSWDGIREAVGKDAELRLLRDRLDAVEEGERLATELSLPKRALAPAREASPRIVLHGNEAVARGAVRAGCTAFFGYPITPAAEIMEGLQKRLLDEGTCYLQSEDEIASAGMMVGASMAGVKAMTSTSGPGLDLMTETIGLASAAEIPMVIVDLQRCGPSTGIPSKSEQSDLNHAIYGGHGDAPRVVLAPYHVVGCYALTIEAFNVASHFQVPVILLSDQWLGQTLVAVEDFQNGDYPILERRVPPDEARDRYRRYEPTADDISPMSAAGDEGFVYQTSGLTRTEKGSPAFDADTQQMLHRKRWGKLLPLRKRDDLVDVVGPERCDTGIITWGSSAPFVLETVSDLGLSDDIAVCVPQLLHPLPERVERFVVSLRRLLVVEMNFSGQFHRYLRSIIDLPGDTRVHARSGGRLFTRRELAEPIRGLTR
jgi:2-oxoglutarate ferredoxin oxidoreductase subunit alpha